MIPWSYQVIWSCLSYLFWAWSIKSFEYFTYFGRQYGLCAEHSYGTYEFDLASSSIIQGAKELREP